MSKNHKARRGLSPKQELAIDLVLLGKSDREVAESVEVCRQTVCGWRLYAPDFQAALNRRRAEIHANTADRLRELLPEAVDVLASALREGPQRLPVAMKLLDLFGLNAETCGPIAIGPQDAAEVVEEATRQRVFGGPEGPLPVDERERRETVEDWERRREQLS